MVSNMTLTYNINDANEVSVFQGETQVVNQPVSPITGEPFTSYDEAKAWAEAHILERISWMTTPISE
jgi:hypothetical protein